jgi:probable phosphoglycerate mutase
MSRGVGVHDLPTSFLNAMYVMRHGHSEANARGLIVSSLERGTAAYGLTDQGRVQVARNVTAWKQQTNLQSAGAVYCSPFLRACDTAVIASGILEWPLVERISALRERDFGDLDQHGDSGYVQVWAQDELDPMHRQWHVESVLQVRDRVLEILTTLANAHDGQPLLLVTHGDTASILLTTLRQGDLRHHRRIGALSTAQIQKCLVH